MKITTEFKIINWASQSPWKPEIQIPIFLHFEVEGSEKWSIEKKYSQELSECSNIFQMEKSLLLLRIKMTLNKNYYSKATDSQF